MAPVIRTSPLQMIPDHVLVPFLDNQTCAALSRTCWWMYIHTRDDITLRLPTYDAVRKAIQTAGKYALKALHRNGKLYIPCIYIPPRMIRYLHTKLNARFNPELMCMAAEHGHMDMVQSLSQYGWEEGAVHAAARNGHLDVLKYLGDGRRLDDSVTLDAAEHGHEEVLKYLYSSGCNWHPEVTEYAARGGHIHTVAFLMVNGAAWGPRVCAAAAEKGHLELLRVLRRNRCKWDEWTIVLAACNGHLDIVKYAHKRGCPLHYNARVTKYKHVIEYLDLHGCPKYI